MTTIPGVRPVPFARVADDVFVSTSRVMSTTTTLFVRDGRGLLVDPAWLPDELEAIADHLRDHHLRVTCGFSTHPHHDHLLWHPRFGNVPRWAAPRAVETARRNAARLRDELGPGYPDDVLALVGAVEPLSLDEVPEPFGPDGRAETFTAVIHDGHAPGHAALWAPEREVLVVGDMLSDIEVPLPFEPDDLPAYLAGLDALAPFVAQAKVLIPGHGTPTDAPLERLDADRRYLDEVVAGRVPDDPRLDNPGMRDEYQHLVRMVRGA